MRVKKNEGFCAYLKGRIRDKDFIIISALYLGFCLFSAVWWSIHFVPGHLGMSLVFMLFIPAMIVVEYLVGMRFGPIFSVAVLSIAVGGILGSPFSFYSTFSHFDTLLHGISGFVFACLGFAFAECLFGKAKSRRTFAGAIIFGLCFSLGIAVLWEIWEYLGMLLLGMETADDAFVDSFKSFAFYGRSEPVVIEGITKTVIYYGEGQSFVIDGYLDIGFNDTLHDMIICTIGAVLFSVLSVLSRAFAPTVNRLLIPEVRTPEPEREETVSGFSAASEEREFAMCNVGEDETTKEEIV